MPSTYPGSDPVPRKSSLSPFPVTASVYTDEKLLPLAAELGNVPAIGEDDDRSDAAPDLQALVATLSSCKRQILLGMLSRLPVG